MTQNKAVSDWLGLSERLYYIIATFYVYDIIDYNTVIITDAKEHLYLPSTIKHS